MNDMLKRLISENYLIENGVPTEIEAIFDRDFPVLCKIYDLNSLELLEGLRSKNGEDSYYQLLSFLYAMEEYFGKGKVNDLNKRKWLYSTNEYFRDTPVNVLCKSEGGIKQVHDYLTSFF